MVKMGNNGPQQRADLARDLSWGAAAGNLRVGVAAGGRGAVDPVVAHAAAPSLALQSLNGQIENFLHG